MEWKKKKNKRAYVKAIYGKYNKESRKINFIWVKVKLNLGNVIGIMIGECEWKRKKFVIENWMCYAKNGNEWR